MDVVTGTDTSASAGDVGDLLAGVRRLSALAQDAGGADAIIRALARELLSKPGADEIQVHHLAPPESSEDMVVAYMFDGDARLSYRNPRSERPPGVSWVASTGRSFLAGDADELNASVPRLMAAGAMSCALLVPLTERGEVESVVILVRRRGNAFPADAIELSSTLVDQAATALALVRARAEAGTDPVTGCMNHRAMRWRLDEEIGRATRTGGPLSCLLIDLDDFKQVNDRHGHPAGDAMLRGVVQGLAREFRSFDRVARYGGDEFVVILPNADLDSAYTAAARALARLQAGVFGDGSGRGVSEEGSGGGVSASIGVAQWRAPMSTDALLQACDAALLSSKRHGKGRVTRAAETVG